MHHAVEAQKSRVSPPVGELAGPGAAQLLGLRNGHPARRPERDVPECDQTGAQRDLELQGAFDRNRLQEPVLGGRRGEKRQASEKAKVGTADRIDGTNAGSRAKERLKDEP